MAFAAKTLIPQHGNPDSVNGAYEEAAQGDLTLLEAPPGYLLTEGLALAFTQYGRHPLWLRLGPEDSDPATFLLSVVAAARRARRDAGQATLELMTQRPGPVFGWPPLFTQLADDLRRCLGANGALVLEDIQHASGGSGTLSLAGRHLLPGLAGAGPCVLVSRRAPQDAAVSPGRRRTASDLRLPVPAVGGLLDQWAPELTARARMRAVSLIDGRAGILAGLREVAGAGHRLAALLRGAASRDELVGRTAELLLTGTDREARRALGLAAHLEYAHPGLTAAAGLGELPAGPWLQPLEDGWTHVRPSWLPPLRAALGRDARPGRDALHQSADWLAQAGAWEQAMALYLDIGDHDCAARVITGQADALMDLGQWETAERWLARLPEQQLAAHPGLSFSRADIAAARGDTATAQHWFDVAASRYARRKDVEGECRSMLAGSAVAAEAGQLTTAMSRAQAVSALAKTGDLTDMQMWASWQLGRVCLAAGDNDGALTSFRLAASSAAAVPEAAANQPVRVAGNLALEVDELRRRQEAHREAQAVLNQAEHEALNQLMAAIRTPAMRDGLGADGWSRAPGPLKLSGLVEFNATEPETRARPATWLRRALRPRREAYAAVAESPPCRDVAALSAGPPASVVPVSAQLPGETAGRVKPASPRLAVHLLGPLYVAFDDAAVDDWPSARCRSVFGYLITHREPGPAREVLMEAFWPESSPEASRNSLNVALHGLRKTLRSITEQPVVVHTGGSYRISQDLQVWLDTDAFDSRVKSGRRLEEAGDTEQAMREYEFADGLYRGDFMAGDPYEDWTALTRERLRLAHLDVLGRLSNLYFAAGRYTACAGLCQRIVERDPCREDAHRRLMRCYSRQGQPHLALMQYRACAQALADELGVETDPATARLHQSIRRHERV
jgi:DNA-binding SARP family transcriptional activator